MESVVDRIGLVKSDSERLQHYLNSLTPGAWSRPSACDAWEVRDVVAHLTGAVDMFAGNISRGVRGDSSPPEGFPPAGMVDMAARMEANAQRSIALRESLGETLLPTFSARCDYMNRLLAGLGSEDWDKPCYHPAAIIPVRTYIDLRITELAVHEWDIRSKLQPSAHLSAGCLPAIMDLIPVFLVGRLFQPGSKLSAPVRYRFELTGTVPGGYDIVAGGGKARMEPATASPAEVKFRCDTETFVLLAYGRTNVKSEAAARRLFIDGDRGLAAKFG